MAVQHGKQLGHQNHKQKINHLVKLKKDNVNLMQVRGIQVHRAWHALNFDLFSQEKARLQTEMSRLSKLKKDNADLMQVLELVIDVVELLLNPDCSQEKSRLQAEVSRQARLLAHHEATFVGPSDHAATPAGHNKENNYGKRSVAATPRFPLNLTSRLTDLRRMTVAVSPLADRNRTTVDEDPKL